VRIQIEIEVHDPPRGHVLGPDARTVTFVGWLGLMRVLSDIITGDAPAADGG
jgi:hypothetical protein